MDIGNISPFYRTSSPIEAAALLPKGISRPIKSSRAREPPLGDWFRDGRGASFPKVFNSCSFCKSASYCLHSITSPALNKLLRVQFRASKRLLPHCKYLHLITPLLASR